MQTVVLIAGSITITYLGLEHVGGWEELRATIGPDHFNMWRPMSNPEFPWKGLLFDGTILVAPLSAAGSVPINRLFSVRWPVMLVIVVVVVLTYFTG